MKTNRRKFIQQAGIGIIGLSLNLKKRPTSNAGVVQFWDMNWGPSQYQAAAKKLVARFNVEHPEINCRFRPYPWPEWPQNFDRAITAGELPDLSTGGAYQAAQYYDKGEILEIDDVVANLQAIGKDKDFIQGTLESMVYKGHYVALPWAIDIRLPYYREDIFLAAGVKEPSTWDELRSVAKTLTSGNSYGFVLPGKELDGMHFLFLLMLNNGGGMFTTERKLDLMNIRNVEALTFLSDLVKDGSVHPGSLNFTSAQARDEFAAGSGAIYIDTPGFTKLFPGQDLHIQLMSPPAAPHGDKGTFFAVNNIMLYKRGGNHDGAKIFLKWWSENQKSLWTEGNCDQLPVRKSIAADPYFQNNAYTKKIFEQWVPIGKTTGTHFSGFFPAINQVEGSEAMMTLFHDLLRGNDVITSMQQAEAKLKVLLGTN